MSEYPADMKRIEMRLDVNGREATRTVETPAAWADMSDEARCAWATGQCDAFATEYIDVTWSDPDETRAPDEWPTSWDGRTGERVE